MMLHQHQLRQQANVLTFGLDADMADGHCTVYISCSLLIVSFKCIHVN